MTTYTPSTPNTPIDHLHEGEWKPARYLRQLPTHNGVIHNLIDAEGRLKIAYSDEAIRPAQLPEARAIAPQILAKPVLAFDWEQLERLIRGETKQPESTHPAKTPLESPATKRDDVRHAKKGDRAATGQKQGAETIFDSDLLPF